MRSDRYSEKRSAEMPGSDDAQASTEMTASDDAQANTEMPGSDDVQASTEMPGSKEPNAYNNSKKKGKANKTKKLILVIVLGIALITAAVVAWQMLKPFKLKGDAEMSVELNATWKDPGTNCSWAEASGTVDTSKVGDYTLTYTKLNKKLTRKVHVVDSSILVMGFRGSEHTLVKQGEEYIESGAFAIDKTVGPITDIKIKGTVDTSKVGMYKVTYTATSNGVTKDITREVEVVAADKFEADTDGISVLMYHYVYTDADTPSDLSANYIKDTDFEQQLKYLKDNNYYYPSWKEIRAYVDGKISLPAKSVVLTFDDAQYGFFDYGVPLLSKYKIPATSFAIGVQSGSDKIKLRANPYVVFESHSWDMHHGGGNIGHGGVISAMTQAQIVEDLTKAANMCGSKDAFAYPYGDNTDAAKAAVAEVGIQCAFTTEFGRVTKGADYRALPRVRVSGGNSLEYWIGTL